MLEFILASMALVGAGACLLLLLERFFLARQLEYDAARSALSALSSRAARPLLRCSRRALSATPFAVRAALHCDKFGREVTLRR